jgi:hypothetical protein
MKSMLLAVKRAVRERRMVFRVIVGVGQAEEFVEALAGRGKFRHRA